MLIEINCHCAIWFSRTRKWDSVIFAFFCHVAVILSLAYRQDAVTFTHFRRILDSKLLNRKQDAVTFTQFRRSLNAELVKCQQNACLLRVIVVFSWFREGESARRCRICALLPHSYRSVVHEQARRRHTRALPVRCRRDVVYVSTRWVFIEIDCHYVTGFSCMRKFGAVTLALCWRTDNS